MYRIRSRPRTLRHRYTRRLLSDFPGSTNAFRKPRLICRITVSSEKPRTAETSFTEYHFSGCRESSTSTRHLAVRFLSLSGAPEKPLHLRQRRFMDGLPLPRRAEVGKGYYLTTG